LHTLAEQFDWLERWVTKQPGQDAAELAASEPAEEWD
jgi:hypothetical protein